MFKARKLNVILLLLAIAGLAFAQGPLTVHEIMVSAITPATNTLWGVGNPQTADDWQKLDDAAVVVIAAATLIAEGGAGPSDNDWAQEDEWQAQVATLLGAAKDARAAVRERDLDALFAANDAIYPPCEECHIAYHPGMQQP